MNIILMKVKVHVNAKDQYGQTALILAASGGHAGVVNALLEKAC